MILDFTMVFFAFEYLKWSFVYYYILFWCLKAAEVPSAEVFGSKIFRDFGQ